MHECVLYTKLTLYKRFGTKYITPISSQLIVNDHALNSNYYKQNQFSEEMKHSLIKLSTSYWFNL